MLVQLLVMAGAPAVGAAQKAWAQASGTFRAQRLLVRLQLLRQPQLRQRAWARLLLGGWAQPPTLQAPADPCSSISS